MERKEGEEEALRVLVLEGGVVDDMMAKGRSSTRVDAELAACAYDPHMSIVWCMVTAAAPIVLRVRVRVCVRLRSLEYWCDVLAVHALYTWTRDTHTRKGCGGNNDTTAA